MQGNVAILCDVLFLNVYLYDMKKKIKTLQ